MLGRDFKRWAAHGVRNYGSDPWHFLRELVQNARDAAARTIQVQTAIAEGRETIVFADDGTGMGLDHARRYLFRLYASSKQGSERFAGEFGIGFWTVLHFGFERLLIESRTAREAWAVALDREFSAEHLPCQLAERGTRITLTRPAVHATAPELAASVRAALIRTCRCLHPLDHPDRLLPVVVDGSPLPQELRLDSPLQLRFRDGPVEGVVGLAERPQVDLYARGLPVWTGLVLDELSHVGAPDRYRVELARGLAPVFLLNGRRLRVDASRTAVLDDGNLAQLRGAARRALARLVRRHLQQQFPRSWPVRLLDRARDALGSLGRRHAAYAAVAALYLATLATLLWLLLPAPPRPVDPVAGLPTPTVVQSAPSPPGDPIEPAALPDRYGGARVDPPGVAPSHELTYRPPRPLWFRVLVADRYDPGRGLVAADQPDWQQVRDQRCQRGCVEVALRTRSDGRTLLPLPLGYEIEASSIRFQGAAVGPLQIGAALERSVVGASGIGTFEYRIGPGARQLRLSAAERRRLLEAPVEPQLPDDLVRAIRGGRRLGTARRLTLAAQLTVDRMTFDNSAAAAARSGNADGDTDWLAAALAAQRGDCDVVNGVHALLLRALGVPARLAIGLVGQQGRATGALHAWTEYFDRGWHSVDVSPLTVRSTAPSSGPHAVPAEVAVAAPRELPRAAATPVAAPAPGPEIAPALASAPDPAPAMAPAMVPAPPVAPPEVATMARSPDQPRWPWVAAIALAALAVAAALTWTWRRSRHGDRFERRVDDAGAQNILVEMVINALAQPAAWRSARPIWSHPLLPLIGGGRLALGRAVRLARQHRLFGGRRGQLLTDQAVAAGNPVLDLGHPLFAPAIAGVRGLIDLGRFEALRPLAAGSGVSDAGRELLAAANALLRRSGGDVALLPIGGRHQRTFFDVDLSRLRLPADTAWPGRYVAVAVDSPFFEACVETAAGRPRLARFRLAHGALRSSLFLVDRSARILRGAALFELQEASR